MKTRDVVRHLALSDRLGARARWVEQRLADAHTHRIAQHEETLTESILLDLKLDTHKQQPRLKVETFSRQTENRRSGADWMWWWQGNRRWFGSLVQAKTLKGSTTTPMYEVGYQPTAPGAPPQIDRLIAAQSFYRLPAVYAFYNPPTATPRSGACPLHPPGSSVEGVTVADAEIVRGLLSSSGRNISAGATYPTGIPLADIAPYARPLPCLATCAFLNCNPWTVSAFTFWALGRTGSAVDDGDPLLQAVVAWHVRLRLRGLGLVDDTEADAIQFVGEGLRDDAPDYLADPESLREGQWPRGLQGDGEGTAIDRIVVVSSTRDDEPEPRRPN